MPTATSETESKSLDLSICVHHCTLRAPCPNGQENESTPIKIVTPPHPQRRQPHKGFQARACNTLALRAVARSATHRHRARRPAP